MCYNAFTYSKLLLDCRMIFWSLNKYHAKFGITSLLEVFSGINW